MAGLFGGAAKPPPVIAPPPMPDAQSPSVLEASRRAAAEAAMRGGRASTIVTGDQAPDANRGGTDSYSGSRLGGT